MQDTKMLELFYGDSMSLPKGIAKIAPYEFWMVP